MMAKVNLETAREVLGVDASADAGAVRRAYLRLLKKHNPERDPEGFKQLREAFELARDAHGRDVSGESTRMEFRVEPTEEVARTDGASANSGEPGEAAEVALDEGVAPASTEAPARGKSSPPRPWTVPLPAAPKDAAPILTDWLVSATREPEAPPPPSLVALNLLWALLHRRAFKTARPLYLALDAYREHAGLRGLEVQWTLTEALWSQRTELPPPRSSPRWSRAWHRATPRTRPRCSAGSPRKIRCRRISSDAASSVTQRR